MNIEEKIASYTKPNCRIQLLKITTYSGEGICRCISKEKYQIRINRKVVYNTPWENIAKKKLAIYITEDLLQQTFNF